MTLSDKPSKMRRASLPRLIAIAPVISVLSGCCPPFCPPPRVACVDFEAPLASGTRFEASSPSETIFTSNGVEVLTAAFQTTANQAVFGSGRITDQAMPLGQGQNIILGSMNLVFDFTALPFPVSKVTFSAYDTSGSMIENLSVNRSPLFVGQLIAPQTQAPTSIGGAAVTVTTESMPPPSHNVSGRVEISGSIDVVVVGGSELWIDNVCAYN